MPTYEVPIDQVNAAMADVNLDDVETAEFGLIEPGWYAAQIVDFTVREGSKAPYISWQFQLFANGSESQEPFKYSGRFVWSITTLAAHALFSFKALVQATGYEWQRGVGVSEQLPDLLDRAVSIKVEVEKYNDEDRNRVARYSTYEGALPELGLPSGVIDDSDIPF